MAVLSFCCGVKCSSVRKLLKAVRQTSTSASRRILKAHPEPQGAGASSRRILSLKAHPQPQGASSASRRILSGAQPQGASSASRRILSLNAQAHPQPQGPSSAAFTSRAPRNSNFRRLLALARTKVVRIQGHTVPSYGLGSIKEVGVAGVSQDIPAPRVLIEVPPA